MAPANSTATHPLKNESIVDSTAATTMGALILSIVFLLGFPGNLFIIWSILARARKQSITTLLILNLAIADGSLMALTPFFVAYLVMKRWAFGTVMCKRVAALLGRKTVTWTLAGVWALVAVASVPAIIFRDVKTSNERDICDSFHERDAHTVIQYTLELVLGFLIPYSIVVVSYICILLRIRRTKFRRRIRSEKLILAIVVTFCVFWLPYHIVNIVHVTWALCPEGSAKTTLAKIWHRGRAVTSSVAFISSCANPVLYFFAGKSYIRREGFAFMARLFEAVGLDSATRKSRQNSQNSRDKDKEAEGVMLKEKVVESNSSSALKALKLQT
ncbi:leukotriene B4 receptor 1-like isoform X2 [Corythoichthys intestinalis]|uniref:leukotriene B4 receptor 1-like isoform X2 n=1 Tax=Corythoichthys intestinalis TaxID=161448 RepID=UPI0025A55041|nr:leukotriene B4 receptor 1-like isoform X2 [Corythoichthys intestinalis]